MLGLGLSEGDLVLLEEQRDQPGWARTSQVPRREDRECLKAELETGQIGKAATTQLPHR